MSEAGFDVAWHSRRLPGQTACGDMAQAFPTAAGVWLVVADGLGHGAMAHAAASTAVAMVGTVAQAGARLVDAPLGAALTQTRVSLPAFFFAIHERLKETVGAALGIAYLEKDTGIVRFAGVGNIALRRLGSADTRMVSRDGIVGQRMALAKPMDLRLQVGDLLLFTTDGVTDRFGPEEYPGLRGDSAKVVARTVVDRFGREHDDATCLALRYGS